MDSLSLGALPADIAVSRGTIGIAIRAGSDCVMARLTDVAEVWTPPDIYLAPGEFGCDGDAAAIGQAQRDPR